MLQTTICIICTGEVIKCTGSYQWPMHMNTNRTISPGTRNKNGFTISVHVVALTIMEQNNIEEPQVGAIELDKLIASLKKSLRYEAFSKNVGAWRLNRQAGTGRVR